LGNERLFFATRSAIKDLSNWATAPLIGTAYRILDAILDFDDQFCSLPDILKSRQRICGFSTIRDGLVVCPSTNPTNS